ncbi:MAG: polysaccharide pyruvyl transferase CsaB [Clostridia bacterium]|nr:polysaccharide pyruvyl transferase CsaB [Clostridia bacterium]
MKVLHLISGGDSGGAKTHVFALLDALKTMIDVKIVCLTPGVFYQQLQERNIENVLVLQKSRFDLSVIRSIAEMVKNEGYALIHAHGARANFIAQYVKQRVHIPVITTVHSDYLMDFDGFYRKLVYTSLNVRALRKMDYYIGVSTNFRNMLIKRGFRPNRVFTVYNGMDYSKDPVFDDRAAFAKRIGIEYDPSLLYIGLIGRHDHVKGHDIFIRAAAVAAKENPNLRFIIAGDGEGREALVRLAESEGISDKLTFAGFIQDIYSFINFIDINTLSSRSESFPYVLLEGARMKKPTISAAVGGIPDLIEEGVTGLLFPAEDYTTFAKKILQFAQDASLRASLGEALFEKATNHFSNTSLAKEHVKIYNAVLRDYTDKAEYDVVLSGYYGFHNSGDDALLQAVLCSLRKQMPFIRALVLSAKPCETREQYGTDSAHRFNYFGIRRICKRSHMLIFGGGSLLQDVTSAQSLWYYLWIMRTARSLGAKVYLYANGIGPLHGKNIKRTAKEIEKCHMVTLRDAVSLQELKDMGVTQVPMQVTADPAFALDGISSKEVDMLFEEEGIPTGMHYIGISLRPWPITDKSCVQKIAKCLDYAADTYGLIPIFIPMKRYMDSKAAIRLSEHMHTKLYILQKEYQVNETIGIVRKCDIVLGMRLHTLIYAAAGGVPMIGLTYDPKVSSFMQYIGQDRTINMQDIHVDILCAYIDDICENREKIQEMLHEKANVLREKAEENAAIACQILQNQENEENF